eukprot:ANDGO_02882.mRNA.1 Pre-mRNA-splicing factor rse1
MDNLSLAHFPLVPSRRFTCAVFGSFSAPKRAEIAAGVDAHLQLWRIDSAGKVRLVLSVNVYAVVRSIVALRLGGDKREVVALGTDSGCFVVFEFSGSQVTRLCCEPLCRSGLRRQSPGFCMVADPRGRAVFTAGVERDRYMFLLSRDSTGRFSVSSPAEFHEDNAIVVDAAALETGYDNPLFASLEIRRRAPAPAAVPGSLQVPIPDITVSTFLVIYEFDLGLNRMSEKYQFPVPDNSHRLCAHPVEGVVVCAPHCMSYFSSFTSEPRRMHIPEVAWFSSVVTMRAGSGVSFIVQSEDAFTWAVRFSSDLSTARSFCIPNVPRSLVFCSSKSGLLFCCAELGHHALLQVDLENNGSVAESLVLDRIPSFSPLLDLSVDGNDNSLLLLHAVDGSNSALTKLRLGVGVSEIAAAEMPQRPRGVWFVDSFIVVTFADSTIVLEVGETVEQTSNHKFIEEQTTIACHKLLNGVLQVTATGLRIIWNDSSVYSWTVPAGSQISHATGCGLQVLVTTTAQTMFVFDVDHVSNVVSRILSHRLEQQSIVSCLALGPSAPGKRKSLYGCVGFADGTVRTMTLQDIEFSVVSRVALPNQCDPVSLCLWRNVLCIGTNSGVLVCCDFNASTGGLSNLESHVVGDTPVSVKIMKWASEEFVMVLSNKVWMYSDTLATSFYPNSAAFVDASPDTGSEEDETSGSDIIVASEVDQRQSEGLFLIPMVVDFTMNDICAFSSSQSDELSCVSVSHNDNILRIFTLLKSDNPYHVVSEISITGSARKFRFLSDPQCSIAAVTSVAHADQYVLSICRIPDQVVSCTEPFPAGYSISALAFDTTASGCILFVATNNGTDGRSFVRTLLVSSKGALSVIHDTALDSGEVTALSVVNGLVIAAVGTTVRLYSVGKSKLLRISERRNATPGKIVAICVLDDATFALSDVREGFFVYKYDATDHSLYCLANSIGAHFVSCACAVDGISVASGDKFGNVLLSRVAMHANDMGKKEDTSEESSTWQGGAWDIRQPIEPVAAFYLGDVLTSIKKSRIGRYETALIYSTIGGSIGVLVPFQKQSEAALFQSVEMLMNGLRSAASGMSHLKFRGKYAPSKAVVDTEFCSSISAFPSTALRRLEAELGVQHRQVSAKLHEMRSKLL